MTIGWKLWQQLRLVIYDKYIYFLFLRDLLVRQMENLKVSRNFRKIEIEIIAVSFLLLQFLFFFLVHLTEEHICVWHLKQKEGFVTITEVRQFISLWRCEWQSCLYYSWQKTGFSGERGKQYRNLLCKFLKRIFPKRIRIASYHYYLNPFVIGPLHEIWKSVKQVYRYVEKYGNNEIIRKTMNDN